MSVPNSAEVSRQVEAIKSSLGTSSWPPVRAVDDALTAISVLSFELVRAAEGSTSVLRRATTAFEWLSKLEPGADEFDEVAELRSRLAFVAWRHARALGDTLSSQTWLERFDENFHQASVDHDLVVYFLQLGSEERSEELNERFLSDPESLFAVCAAMRERRNSVPATLANELPALQEWVGTHFWPVQFADERAYFLTQFDISRGVCARWMGDRMAAIESFRQAELSCDKTPDCEIGRAEVELARLTTAYDAGYGDAVLSRLPALQEKLGSLGMASALVKSRLLEAGALKKEGRAAESAGILEGLLKDDALKTNKFLNALALESLADSYNLLGRAGEASKCVKRAFDVLGATKEPIARAFLKLVVGGLFTTQGDWESALLAYRDAQNDYEVLQLETWQAYARLLVAESLLSRGRESEAETEILAALPTIEKQVLVREGLAAALLRESIRRRKMDRNALRELREELRGKV